MEGGRRERKKGREVVEERRKRENKAWRTEEKRAREGRKVR